jgi:peptide/nickel transport system permease protein
MTSKSFKSRFQEWKKAQEPGLKELRFALNRIRKSPLSLVGLFIIIFFAVLAASAPFIAPLNPPWDLHRVPDPFIIPKASQSYDPQAPTLSHPLGLTVNGFDVFYGCVWGTITAFRVGAFVVAVSLVIGLAIGLAAGYYGGVIDEVLMRFTDVIIAFPALIFSMALVIALPSMVSIPLLIFLIPVAAFFLIFSLTSLLGRRTKERTLGTRTIILIAITGVLVAIAALILGGVIPDPGALTVGLTRLDKVIISLVLVGWPGYTRVIRGEVLRARSEDYVEAARAIGASDLRVITHHIIPNTIYPILIMASLDIGSIVLLAAGLSFLGIGSDPNYADWGQLIQQTQNYMVSAGDLVRFWYIWLIPGAFIFTFSLGWNLLGDAVRDILDPTLRRR